MSALRIKQGSTLLLTILATAAIGALSLSPAVAGWIEIDWDAPSSSWLRVQ